MWVDKTSTLPWKERQVFAKQRGGDKRQCGPTTHCLHASDLRLQPLVATSRQLVRRPQRRSRPFQRVFSMARPQPAKEERKFSGFG